jgi:hypothetical protein
MYDISHVVTLGFRIPNCYSTVTSLYFVLVLQKVIFKKTICEIGKYLKKNDLCKYNINTRLQVNYHKKKAGMYSKHSTVCKIVLITAEYVVVFKIEYTFDNTDTAKILYGLQIPRNILFKFRCYTSRNTSLASEQAVCHLHSLWFLAHLTP